MVLTNIECWAFGGNQSNNGQLDELASRNSRDLFNPRLVLETCGSSINGAVKPISHTSSNGYYGFSYINAAHAEAEQNNNNTISGNANYVNDVSVTIGGLNSPRLMTIDIDEELHGAAFNNKKRGFVDEETSYGAKKCRFDRDDSEAQYCNDFFRMSSQQIGTQSCLMDTEEMLHQPTEQQRMHQFQQNADGVQSPVMPITSSIQQTIPTSAIHLEQVDGMAMSPPSNAFNTFFKSNSQHIHLQSDGNTTASNAINATPATTTSSTAPLRLYPANRGDISRCVLSHMI